MYSPAKAALLFHSLMRYLPIIHQFYSKYTVINQTGSGGLHTPTDRRRGQPKYDANHERPSTVRLCKCLFLSSNMHSVTCGFINTFSTRKVPTGVFTLTEALTLYRSNTLCVWVRLKHQMMPQFLILGKVGALINLLRFTTPHSPLVAAAGTAKEQKSSRREKSKTPSKDSYRLR